jgi:hypothetical protein
MTGAVPYINAFCTLTENVFNLIGYLPKDQFPKLNAWSTKYRTRFALIQAIAGIALLTFGILADILSQKPPDKQKYLTLAQQARSLGVLYINHSIFNVIRAYIEQKGWGFLTAAYDFYGRKFLPSLAPPFDLQGHLFERIRRQLDRIHFITIFPPDFSLRA